MGASLLSLQEGDDDSIIAMLRADHSIKVKAGNLRFNEIAQFTHLVET